MTEGTYRRGGGGAGGFMSDELFSIQSREAEPLFACCTGWWITKKTPSRFQQFSPTKQIFPVKAGSLGWLDPKLVQFVIIQQLV